ncbi:MAG: hypothetical protein LBH68_00970 [Bifidobacteriaceae bacterium]|nr:hypothetical protein [Bifidobacteriaceae bacterium]
MTGVGAGWWVTLESVSSPGSTAPGVVLLTRDQALATTAAHAIWEAGAGVQRLDSPDQLDALAPAPRLMICGQDIPAAVGAAVRQTWPTCQLVWAALGDEAWGSADPCLVLPQATERLVWLIEETFAAPPTAQRIALIGAHGGAGTSCLAVALALRLTRGGHRSRLAALNPAGAPVGPLLGLGGDSGWGEAVAATNEGRPLTPSVAEGIELLSPAGPDGACAAWQVKAVLESWERQSAGGFTVLDGGLSSPGGAWRIASWAQLRILICRADPAGLAALARASKQLDALGLAHLVAVRQVPGGPRPTSLPALRELAGLDGPVGGSARSPAPSLGGFSFDAQPTGVPAAGMGAVPGSAARPAGGNLINIRAERNLVAGLVHGLTPGERPSGALAVAAGEVAALALGEPTGGRRSARTESAARKPARAPAAPRGEARARHRRPKMPGFNPAVFAEEW